MTDAEMKAWLETQYDLNENGCWIWKGIKNSGGYGQVRLKGKNMGVHCLYWLLSGREIPDKFEMRHGFKCSRACYNPEHLTPGTRSENTLDKHRDGTMPCKLTPSQILEIRARTDKNNTELAEEYGVVRHTISQINLRKVWKWL
jgi:hypothetical protein